MPLPKYVTLAPTDIGDRKREQVYIWPYVRIDFWRALEFLEEHAQMLDDPDLVAYLQRQYVQGHGEESPRPISEKQIQALETFAAFFRSLDHDLP